MAARLEQHSVYDNWRVGRYLRWRERGLVEDKPVDRDIQDVIADERRRGRGGPAGAEQRRKKKTLARGALKAIQLRDERMFAEQLRLAGVREGSDEWVRAWRIFRSAPSGPFSK